MTRLLFLSLLFPLLVSAQTVIFGLNTLNGALASGKGPDLASAATITPTHFFHDVTGVVSISTITPPSGAQSGQMFILRPKGLFLTLVTGNIQLATTAVVDRIIIFVWDAALSKWSPSY